MIGGLLAGAMAGGGKAVQQNAQNTLQARRQEALKRLDNELALGRMETENQYQVQRDERQQGYTQENAQMGHELTMEQERYRQGQQNSRAAMSRQQQPQWQLVPTEDGGYVQYDPVSNTTRPANLPEGVNMGGGKLSDREKYQLDGIADRIDSIRSTAEDEMRPLTKEEKLDLGRLEGRYNALLGSGDLMTPLERLQAGEAGGGQQGGQPPSGDRQPAPDPSSIEGQTRQRQEARRNTQEAIKARREANDARDAADAVLERIERERGGGATPGGLLSQVNQAAGRGGVSQETIAEAQRIADQILSLDQNADISDDDRRWLSERLIRLQEAGVPLNLDQ